MPRPKKSRAGVYGEVKKQCQFMLTPTASEELDNIAEAAGITRSECLERLIRTANWDTVKNYQIPNQKEESNFPITDN
jgi:hypothetical protein